MAIFVCIFSQFRQSLLEIRLIGILKKFIKGFDLLLFCKAQYIGLSTFFICIFEPQQSFLESLVIGILKKFIKGFDFLLLGRTHNIGLSAIVVWIFIECRQSVLQCLI